MAKNSVADWDTTAANNTDVGGIDINEGCPAANINNAIRETMAQVKTYSGTIPALATVNTYTKIQKWAKGADVASASTLTLGDDGNYFDITGTTTITAIATKGAGTVVKLHFDASLTLTHHATDLILPGGANIITAAGDEFEFTEYATGDWRCTGYALASGMAVTSFTPVVNAKTANYTVVAADKGECIMVDATSGAVTVTLLAAATAGNGFAIVVKKTDSSSNTVTIDADGSETIDGATTRVIRLQHQSVAIVSNGSAWFVLSEGAIFETGSNANGEYIRYANGWQTCAHQILTGVTTASASGNIFISTATANANYPATFVSRPSVNATGASGSSGTGWVITATAPTSTQWGQYRTASSTSDANTNGLVFLNAQGRWF